MNRTTRTAFTMLVVLTTTAAGSLLAAPVAHADAPGIPPVMVGTTGVDCTSDFLTIRINHPDAEPYLGFESSKYDWSVLVDSWAERCQNLITLTAQMTDTPFNASSAPTTSAPATATGWGAASVRPTMTVTYFHTGLASGSQNVLVVEALAVQTNGAPPCTATKSFMYVPTPTGPVVTGQTATEVTPATHCRAA